MCRLRLLLTLSLLTGPASAEPPVRRPAGAVEACSRVRAERERGRRARPHPPVVKIGDARWEPLLLGSRACVPSLVVSGYRLPGLSVGLHRAYRRHRASLEPCERELLRNRGLEGAVAARLTIDADGRVVESRADGAGALGAAARCVLKAMASWRMPTPELGARASLSFPLVVLRQLRPGGP